MSTLYVVHLAAASPPHIVTPDAEQVQAWVADGTAAAVYELAATQTFPVLDPPAEPPETPVETT